MIGVLAARSNLQVKNARQPVEVSISPHNYYKRNKKNYTTDDRGAGYPK